MTTFPQDLPSELHAETEPSPRLSDNVDETLAEEVRHVLVIASAQGRQAGEPLRLGIMGGTFDPVHIGHLCGAEQVRCALGLHAVLFMPAGIPSFKREEPVTPVADRLAMTRLAVATNPAFAVSTLEARRPGVTYTVDTLRELRAALPKDTELFFIVGADAALTLPHWKDASELGRLASYAAMARPGSEMAPQALETLARAGFRVEAVPVTPLDVSSTDVRARVAEGCTIRYLVHKDVLHYIEDHGLYRATEHAEPARRPLKKREGDDGAALPADERQPKHSGRSGHARENEAAQRADPLSEAFYEARKADLKQRLRPKRFQHSLGVADTAAAMARAYGEDEATARIAGLLHDWDKNYDDAAVQARARELGANVSPEVLESMPRLLHGPTAAKALARSFPHLPASVLSAIERHTAASVDMSPLDMIVYIADVIEPSRNYEGVEDLRALVGAVSLEELFTRTYQSVLGNLVATGKRLHPDTAAVWNAYAERRRRRKRGERP